MKITIGRKALQGLGCALVCISSVFAIYVLYQPENPTPPSSQPVMVSTEPKAPAIGLYRNKNADALYTETLLIESSKGTLTASMETAATNSHTCSFFGVYEESTRSFWAADAQSLKRVADNEEGACQVKMSKNADGSLSLEAIPEKDCSYYCGARAQLSLNVMAVPQTCASFLSENLGELMRQRQSLASTSGKVTKGEQAGPLSELAQLESRIANAANLLEQEVSKSASERMCWDYLPSFDKAQALIDLSNWHLSQGGKKRCLFTIGKIDSEVFGSGTLLTTLQDFADGKVAPVEQEVAQTLLDEISEIQSRCN